MTKIHIVDLLRPSTTYRTVSANFPVNRLTVKGYKNNFAGYLIRQFTLQWQEKYYDYTLKQTVKQNGWYLNGKPSNNTDLQTVCKQYELKLDDSLKLIYLPIGTIFYVRQNAYYKDSVLISGYGKHNSGIPLKAFSASAKLDTIHNVTLEIV